MVSKLLTVLMVVKNGMPYLQDSIESIINQTYKDFDFLVIDNNSQDNTFDYLESIKDKRIRLLKFNDGNIIESLNFGLAQINTRYTGIMDADDIADLNRLYNQIQFLENNFSVGLVGSSITFFTDSKKRYWKINLPLESKEIKYGLMNDKYVLSHPTITYRTELVKNIGGYKKKSFPVPDLDLYARLMEITEFANLDDNCLCRITTKSFTSTHLRSIIIKSKDIILEMAGRNKMQKSLIRRKIKDNFRYYSQYFYKIGLKNYLDGSKVLWMFYFIFSTILNPSKAFYHLFKK